jgi:hypothetical protein
MNDIHDKMTVGCHPASTTEIISRRRIGFVYMCLSDTPYSVRGMYVRISVLRTPYSTKYTNNMTRHARILTGIKEHAN